MNGEYHMEWNVFYYNINRRKIDIFNVFDHQKFLEDVKKLIETDDITKDEFNDRLHKEVRYYFWAKTEWEVLVSSWINNDIEMKVDVFYQLHVNWDKFVDYVWSFRE